VCQHNQHNLQLEKSDKETPPKENHTFLTFV
jgi:hypothetical protein